MPSMHDRAGRPSEHGALMRSHSIPTTRLDHDDMEAGPNDSSLSASQLRKRYHYGGAKGDAELTASQLRSRYEVVGRSNSSGSSYADSPRNVPVETDNYHGSYPMQEIDPDNSYSNRGGSSHSLSAPGSPYRSGYSSGSEHHHRMTPAPDYYGVAGDGGNARRGDRAVGTGFVRFPFSIRRQLAECCDVASVERGPQFYLDNDASDRSLASSTHSNTSAQSSLSEYYNNSATRHPPPPNYPYRQSDHRDHHYPHHPHHHQHRDLESSVARSLHWNSARERRQTRKRLLRLSCRALACAAVCLGALFLLTSPSEEVLVMGSGGDQPRQQQQHLHATKLTGPAAPATTALASNPSSARARVGAAFSAAASAVRGGSTRFTGSSGGEQPHAPPPIVHRHHNDGAKVDSPLDLATAALLSSDSGRRVVVGPENWPRACAETVCMGDRVSLDVFSILSPPEGLSLLWSSGGGGQVGGGKFDARQARARERQVRSSSSSSSEKAVAAAVTTCTARIVLVDNPPPSSSSSPAKEKAGGGGQLVKVLADGWAGQAAFWIRENDPALIAKESSLGTVPPLEEDQGAYATDVGGSRVLRAKAFVRGGAAALGNALKNTMGGGGDGGGGSAVLPNRARNSSSSPPLPFSSTFVPPPHPCPFLFSPWLSSDADAPTVAEALPCSVAIRDYCELSAPEPTHPDHPFVPTDDAFSMLLSEVEGVGHFPVKRRRAASCTAAHTGGGGASTFLREQQIVSETGVGGLMPVTAASAADSEGRLAFENEPDGNNANSPPSSSSNNSGPRQQQFLELLPLSPPPVAYFAAQQDGHTSGVCPPPSAFTWAADRWTHPDCSSAMRHAITELELRMPPPSTFPQTNSSSTSSSLLHGVAEGGGEGSGRGRRRRRQGSAQALWWSAQSLLADQGTCPRPETFLWPPDSQTHPNCGSCVAQRCRDSGKTHARAKAAAEASAVSAAVEAAAAAAAPVVASVAASEEEIEKEEVKVAPDASSVPQTSPPPPQEGVLKHSWSEGEAVETHEEEHTEPLQRRRSLLKKKAPPSSVFNGGSAATHSTHEASAKAATEEAFARRSGSGSSSSNSGGSKVIDGRDDTTQRKEEKSSSGGWQRVVSGGDGAVSSSSGPGSSLASCGDNAQLSAAWLAVTAMGTPELLDSAKAKGSRTGGGGGSSSSSSSNGGGEGTSGETLSAFDQEVALILNDQRHTVQEFANAQRRCSAPSVPGGGAGVVRGASAVAAAAAVGGGGVGAGGWRGLKATWFTGAADDAWGGGGLLDGDCPSPELRRWVPTTEARELFPDCAPALALHCRAIVAKQQEEHASKHLHLPKPHAFDCGGGQAGSGASSGRSGSHGGGKGGAMIGWRTRAEAATALEAQARASRSGQCPAPGASGVRGGAAGFVWAAHDQPPPRSALSSRFCELPSL